MENKEFQTLIFSILFHILLAWLLFIGLPKWMPEPPSPPTPVEVTVIEPQQERSKTKQKSFVEDTEQENLDNELRTQADLLSRLNKRVREQMKARESGDTENRGRGNSPLVDAKQAVAKNQQEQQQKQKQQRQQQEQQQQRTAQLDALKPDLGFNRPVQPLEPPGSQSSGGIGHFQVIGNSAISEHIPGIKEGAFTALNTDQFLFYSFFARINRELRSRWVMRVRNYADGLPPDMLQHLASTPSITEVEIVLNSKGDFIKAIIHRSSGDSNLDHAATDSFKDAAPFQNPPAEMVERDNTIRLHYTFYIEWQG